MFDHQLRQFPGNIRSVNIDYLNNNCNNNKLNHGDHEDLKHLSVQERRENKQQNQDRLSRFQLSPEPEPAPAAASCTKVTSKPLEDAILESLIKLKQVNEPNSVVYVRSLVEHLASSSYANLVNYHLLRDSKSIDHTIKSLVENGRLCLSDSAQNRLLTKKAQQQHLGNHELQQQSIFLDQTICLPDDGGVQTVPLYHIHNHHRNHRDRDNTSSTSSSGNSSRISASNDTESDKELLSGERRARLCSSTNTSTTTKSKSTTLDSGIQSWEHMLSDVNCPVDCDDLAADTSKIMYSTSVVGGDQLATQQRQQQQQRQVFKPDPSSLTNYQTTTTTTIDNKNNCDTNEALKQQEQHQPRRSARRCEQVEKSASKRGFSLGRSFSFRNKKMISAFNGAENDQQQLQRSGKTPLDKWATTTATNNIQQNDNNKNEGFVREKRGQNLSSLFRSKSMRIIPTSRSKTLKMNLQHHPRGAFNDDIYQTRTRVTQDYPSSKGQATIDYLAGAQHGRSFSIRRNSLLTFNTKDTNESSGGKIVLFLRKLFNIKRSRQQQHEVVNNNASNIRQSTNVRRGLVKNCSRTNNGYKNGDNIDTSTINRSGTRRNNEKVSSQTQTYNSNMIINETSRSSNSSSASSSLIEILDCSKIADDSRRPFKEAPASNLIESSNKQKATTCWTSLRRPSTIRRSDSSLSHNSEASCSTTKSTVSQQLRRHLDEAYKRHRNCNSQQEREFIDSINVLRQASRHALPPKSSSSRSSSKNHHQTSKSTTSSSAKSASTLNDDTSINSSSYYATNRSCNSRADHESNCRLVKCNCSKMHDRYFNDDVGLTMNIENNNNNNAVQHQHCNQSPQDLDLILKTNTRKLQNNTFNLKQQLDKLDYEFAAPSLNDNHESILAARLSNCCICNSYLNSTARLCPLTCLPTSPSVAPTNPSTSCCLSPNLHQQNIKSLSTDLNQIQKMLPSTSEPANEFCCPLWQSMLCNYFPPFYLPNSQPFADQSALQLTAQTPVMIPEQQQEQQQHHQLSRLENFSSQHQLQQHQHNTTIDLKIEIAPAEFGKMKKIRKNKEGGRGRNGFHGNKVVKDEESPMSSLLHDDDHNHHHHHHTSCQPVESEFERDSCESDSTNDHFSFGSKSDSLEPQQEHQQHLDDSLIRQQETHLETESLSRGR